MTETPPEVPVEEVRSMTIYNVMERILDGVNREFMENGIDLPSKQFFDMGGVGETPHDCEQVSVSLEQMYTGTPGNPEQEPTRCFGPRSGVFVIEVVRCTPVAAETKVRGGAPKPPTVEQLNAKTKQQTQDAYILMDAGLTVAEEISNIGVGVGGLADVTVSPEDGGYQAVVLVLILGLP